MIQIEIINCENSKYPQRLLTTKNYPKQLYVEGNVELLNKETIAIVGSRECSEYGKKETKRFAEFLSKNGICIISGLAIGIDAEAHVSSMNNTGKTIAVIASGFDNIYPKCNEWIYDNIIDNGGCVISEWPPDEKIEMSRFPKRNRIISGIASGVLVIEAKSRSGTLITANYATKQRKEIFCLPGNIDSTNSAGTNKLIQSGANLVTSPTDIMEIMQFKIGDDIYANLTENLKEILEEIGSIPISANQIARKLRKQYSRS